MSLPSDTEFIFYGRFWKGLEENALTNVMEDFNVEAWARKQMQSEIRPPLVMKSTIKVQVGITMAFSLCNFDGPGVRINLGTEDVRKSWKRASEATSLFCGSIQFQPGFLIATLELCWDRKAGWAMKRVGFNIIAVLIRG